MRTFAAAFMVLWTLVAAAIAFVTAAAVLLIPVLSITGVMNPGGLGWLLLGILLLGAILVTSGWATLFGLRRLTNAATARFTSVAQGQFPTGDMLSFRPPSFIPLWASLLFIGLGATGWVVAILAWLGRIQANHPVTGVGLVLALALCGASVLLGVLPLIQVNNLKIDCSRHRYELREGWFWSPALRSCGFEDFNRLLIARELRTASAEDQDDTEYPVHVLHLEFQDGRRYPLAESPTPEDVWNRLLSRQASDDHEIIAAIAHQLAPRLRLAVDDLSLQDVTSQTVQLSDAGPEGASGPSCPLPTDLRLLLPRSDDGHPLHFEMLDHGLRIIIPSPLSREPFAHAVGAIVIASTTIPPIAAAFSAALQYQQYSGLGRWVAIACGMFGSLLLLGALVVLLAVVPRRLARTVLDVRPVSIEHSRGIGKWSFGHASLPLRLVRRIEVINDAVIIRCERADADSDDGCLNYQPAVQKPLILPSLSAAHNGFLADSLRTLVTAFRPSSQAMATRRSTLRASVPAVD